MADFDLFNYDTNPPAIYQQYAPAVSSTSITTNLGDITTIVTTINGGGGGRATGPAIIIGSNWPGVNFVATGNNQLNLDILNANNARGALGAAESGANSDINTFSSLTGSGGWSMWTGTPDKGPHATFSGTAGAAYSQAEMQAVMDSLKNVTET